VAGRSEHGGRDRHVALLVTDLDALIEQLTEANIEISVSKSGRRAAFCRDFDSNTLELIEK